VAALRNLVGVSLGRLADPAEQRWRTVTVQVWGRPCAATACWTSSAAAWTSRCRSLPPALDPDGAARVCASIFQGLGRAHSGTDQGEP
jgi:hypothetical protein